MNDENKQVAAHYIVTFYNNIQQLNHLTSQYTNLLLEIKFKYGDDPNPKAMGEEEKNVIGGIVQNIRHYSNLIFYSYKSIFQIIKQDEESIDNSYNEIKSKFIIELDSLLIFVLKINKIVVSKVIRDLLVTSQDIYSEIYNDNGKQ